MKKSMRITISGSIQPRFFNQFIKEHAQKHNVKGFIRNLESGKAEIFIEGDIEDVNKLKPICERGPQHSLIRDVKVKDEHFQDFKDFRILSF